MAIYSSSMKICGVCAYWSGNRKLIGLSNVSIDSDKGKCYETFVSGVDRFPQSSCPNFVLWEPLKK